MPLRRLHASQRTAMRGEECGERRRDRRAPLRQLSRAGGDHGGAVSGVVRGVRVEATAEEAAPPTLHQKESGRRPLFRYKSVLESWTAIGSGRGSLHVLPLTSHV